MKGSPEAQDSAVDLRPYSARPYRGWTVRTSNGSARSFHELDPDPGTGHEIWIHRIDRPAVVFGSTQVPGRVDGSRGSADRHAADSRIEVCRRRSGGGLVIVQPDDVWIDAIVPRHSPLHSDDVGRAFGWFGQVWLEVLRPLVAWLDVDGREPRLAEPPPGRRAADRAFFCFADTGHGEVLHRDRKIVGISQRRTRTWTRLQSLMVDRWEAAEVEKLVSHALTVVGIPDGDRTALGASPHKAADVRAGLAAGGLLADIGSDTIVRAVLRRLPVVADGASRIESHELRGER